MKTQINEELARTGGILRLEPAYVARDWLPAGHRLGISPESYDVGERGEICERWLGSTTHTDNRVGPDDEGISSVRIGTESVPLPEVISGAKEEILGVEYSRTHSGLGRLIKIFDFAERIPYHIHPPADVARRVGRSSKDEAYFFIEGVDRGLYPETFFGILPHLSAGEAESRLLQYLEAWDSKDVLSLSQAYRQVSGEGFLIESGILHAPGTALTLEIQEDADTMAFFQAENAGEIVSKDLLFKDVSEHDRATRGDAALMDWIDWEANLDPSFFAHHHTPPQAILDQGGVVVEWIYYGTSKFSGKRLTLQPGSAIELQEKGVYSLLVWGGEGTIGGQEVVAGDDSRDELLITHDRAVAGVVFESTGNAPMEVFVFFGPDINEDLPSVPGRIS